MSKVYDVNSINIVGRLTANPEVQYNNEGKARSKFSLASNRGDDVMFIQVRSFGKLAEAIGQYIEKGSRVVVSGRLTSWRSEDGHTRFYIVGESVQFIGYGVDKGDEVK